MTTGTEADLRQEREADYRTFELAGDHATIGYQMGLATPLRPVEHWRDPATDLAFARACAQVVGRFHPPLLDEYRGYAQAQGRPWEEVLPHFSLNLPEGTLSGCTTLARRLPDGHLLVARNYDFLYTQRQRYLFPFNYLVADPHDAFAVEVYPGRVRVRRPAGDGLVVTNYYESPDMRPLQGRRDLTKQIERVRWIEARMAEDAVRDAAGGWAWAERLLRDHTVPVCHHRPNQATLWSLIADLTARRVVYCLGAPCRNEFHEWTWPQDAPPS